ncbi:MAG: hypothetical protein JWN11_2126 [Hyphomicrobiales bacterium]|nr:hypothetical protein [Hyphomicrobiales bacterium]
MASHVTKFQDRGEDLRKEVERSFGPQLNELRKEIAALTDAVTDLGHYRFDELRHGMTDVVSSAVHEGERAMRQLRRQARDVGSTVRDNPVPAVAILAGAALLLAYLARRDSMH